MQAFKTTPFFELAACAIIICLHALLTSRPNLISDALFLEGAALSVSGGIVACRIPKNMPLPDHLEGKCPSQHGLTAFLSRRNGIRILFVGLILIGAAIVVGELFVRLALA